MSKELCFNIENKDLYLEQVLVDYMDIPIFFLCRGEEQYYVALCADIDKLNYIVTRLSLSDVYNLLHGKLPMRDAILKQDYYWNVVSGDEIYLDEITKKNIDALEIALLPEADACFKILTKQMRSFVQKFDKEYFDVKYFSGNNKTVDLSDPFNVFLPETLSESINLFTELVDFKVKKPTFSAEPFYDEKLKPIKTAEVALGRQTETHDLFKLEICFVNNMSVAA